MEYSIGSLADLISGKDTPNKLKLVQKKFTSIKKKEIEGKKKVEMNSKRPEFKSPKKEKKLRKKPTQNIVSIDSEEKNSQNNEKNEKKGRKRKSHVLNNDMPDSTPEGATPKKQKLSENEENAVSRIKNKINRENKNSTEYKERTVFVGNIPINIKKEKIKKHFRKYGQIESVRIRGIPVADVKTSKKVAAIKKEFHPDRNTVYAFIRYVNSEDATKAEAENGVLFQDHHLRVHCCDSDTKPDESKAIFIGNLKFDAEEEELWNIFKPCGPISHVRIVRDARTGMGKGFGYVNFQDADSVQLALEMEKVMFRDRELRISLCDSSRAKKKKKVGKRKSKLRTEQPIQENGEDSTSTEKKVKKDEKISNGQFRGTKFNDKQKKKKFNKALVEKKKLAKKVIASKVE